jgi:hypothetical protein
MAVGIAAEGVGTNPPVGALAKGGGTDSATAGGGVTVASPGASSLVSRHGMNDATAIITARPVRKIAAAATIMGDQPWRFFC